ncbi:hypothetical protein [Sphaerobacter thermophilus]|uniref:Uncharacterized protein n=1 Tax=Sphaerobacter thermophilus (strain ATCC 49802 / DSM 20745 / KCCM 41009 / NCIMB 13125 / S 6022) TaxID=479434 RepID=D1C5I5_SPHTD|nr:hypothetical protein [Sphaerobacter thermophilus]ACZ37501.1 hypothetical protein Sthe_0062 [Sphaerobacter thermophilus DSM 20745]
MSRNLPALPSRVEIEPVSAGGRLRRWLRSPLGAAASEVAPDLVRLAAERVGRRGNSHQTPPGASGVDVSEVEIDLAAPFVRRVVVRTASSWSVSPEVLQPSRRRRRAGRLGLRAAMLAALAMLGLAASRRFPLSLPDGLPGTRPRDGGN